MNLVLFRDDDFISQDQVRISGRRFEHLMKVNRIKVGDQLLCGHLNRKKGRAEVLETTSDHVVMRAVLDIDPPEPLPLTLVLALPRPKMLRRIILDVTTIGVKDVYLVNSWRVEKSYWQTPHLSCETLEKQMILGLEQSCDTIMPKVHQRRFFSQFVNEELPGICEGSLCLTAHPKSIKAFPHAVNEPCVLAIGPEGGFIDREIETFEKIGFKTYQAGQRILRVETAVPFLISRLYV